MYSKPCCKVFVDVASARSLTSHVASGGFADTAGINASITAAGRAVCWEVALGLLLHMEAVPDNAYC